MVLLPIFHIGEIAQGATRRLRGCAASFGTGDGGSRIAGGGGNSMASPEAGHLRSDLFPDRCRSALAGARRNLQLTQVVR